MRQRPREFESDLLGRPYRFERLHLVDATAFPTLPAAPPTLTIMANAMRIASEATGEGPG
jgi:choline dehydrogenase-like flavoprotein